MKHLKQNLAMRKRFVTLSKWGGSWYIKCSVEECEKRDPKGLYKKARNQEIKNFTGISAPYEAPENPEIVLDTEQYSIEQCVEQLTSILIEKKLI